MLPAGETAQLGAGADRRVNGFDKNLAGLRVRQESLHDLDAIQGGGEQGDGFHFGQEY